MNLINRSADYELLDLGNKLKIPNFIVCSKPDLKENLKKYDNIIFNMSDSSVNGTHWVFCSPKYKIYFDSYAQPKATIVPKSYKSASTKKEIQAIDGNNCGQLCVLFAYYLNFKSKEEFYKLFKDIY